MHVKELRRCCTLLGLYKHFRWRSWLGVLDGVQLWFLFFLWLRSQNREKNQNFMEDFCVFFFFLTRDSKKDHTYPVMARVVWNTAHVVQLGVREGLRLNHAVFGVRDC